MQSCTTRYWFLPNPRPFLDLLAMLFTMSNKGRNLNQQIRSLNYVSLQFADVLHYNCLSFLNKHNNLPPVHRLDCTQMECNCAQFSPRLYLGSLIGLIPAWYKTDHFLSPSLSLCLCVGMYACVPARGLGVYMICVCARVCAHVSAQLYNPELLLTHSGDKIPIKLLTRRPQESR